MTTGTPALIPASNARLSVPITPRALGQRVRRALARRGDVFHKCNPRSQWYRDLGDYYTVNERNHIIATHCDLAELGRELGVLRAHEEVAS